MPWINIPMLWYVNGLRPVSKFWKFWVKTFIYSIPSTVVSLVVKRWGNWWLLGIWGRTWGEGHWGEVKLGVWNDNNEFLFISYFAFGPGLCSTFDYSQSKSRKANQQKPWKFCFGIRMHFTNLAVHKTSVYFLEILLVSRQTYVNPGSFVRDGMGLHLGGQWRVRSSGNSLNPYRFRPTVAPREHRPWVRRLD